MKRVHGLWAVILLMMLGFSTASAATWAPTASMASRRSSHTATLLGNGKVLVTGGYEVTTTLQYHATTELYTPGNYTWSAAAPMQRARIWHTATLLQDGRVLVAGGSGISGSLAHAEVYNPATNLWTATASMGGPHREHAAVALQDGRVLVTGGWSGSLVTASAELYNPATNAWTSAGAMLKPRAQHSTTLLPNGKVLVMGGYNGSTYWPSAELYDPVTNTWSSAGTMNSARVLFPAVRLPNGKVLAVGGNSGGTVLSSVDLYDPATNSWSAAAPLGTPRYVHTATLLGDGKVLAVGAYGRSSAELYDPAANTWTPAGTMSTTRGEHSATLLGNGALLVAGGSAVSELATAELYVPSATVNLGSALGGPVTQGNTCGGTNLDTPACSESTAPDRSFVWKAPSSGSFTFTTAGSDFDTILSISDATTGASLGCSDDVNGTFQSALTLSLSAGRQVRILVDGYRARCGNFQLNIQSP